MVGAPGTPAQNNFPHTVALLAFATALAAAPGSGEQERDGAVSVADGLHRGRRTCRLSDRTAAAALILLQAGAVGFNRPLPSAP
jgi:hypothetical protein